MFKKVTKILGVIALTGWMGAANATLIFDFSWDSSNGTVTGEVLGLADNATGQRASGVLITSLNGITSAPSVDFFDSAIWDIISNVFDVAGGQIVYWDVYAMSHDFNGDLVMDSGFGSGSSFEDNTTSIRYASRSTQNRNLFIKRVTVPEPSSVILMLLGLAGLSFARYRKQY